MLSLSPNLNNVYCRVKILFHYVTFTMYISHYFFFCFSNNKFLQKNLQTLFFAIKYKPLLFPEKHTQIQSILNNTSTISLKINYSLTFTSRSWTTPSRLGLSTETDAVVPRCHNGRSRTQIQPRHHPQGLSALIIEDALSPSHLFVING